MSVMVDHLLEEGKLQNATRLCWFISSVRCWRPWKICANDKGHNVRGIFFVRAGTSSSCIFRQFFALSSCSAGVTSHQREQNVKLSFFHWGSQNTESSLLSDRVLWFRKLLVNCCFRPGVKDKVHFIKSHLLDECYIIKEWFFLY